MFCFVKKKYFQAVDCICLMCSANKCLLLTYTEGNCKIAILADGINQLFSETSLIVRDRPTWRWGSWTRTKVQGLVPMEDISAVTAIKKLLG